MVTGSQQAARPRLRDDGWVRVPLRVATDVAQGGRWTSLEADGRDWLWRRIAPAREHVSPGDDFVDAGGLEECLPTVRGRPDHGAFWSVPWLGSTEDAVGEQDGFRLRRRVTDDGGSVVASYQLSGRPGRPFVWAAHALLDVSADAVLECAPGAVRLFPEAAPLLRATGHAWPPGAPHLDGDWPNPYGVPLNRLGPNDGSAVGAVLIGRRRVLVVDGDAALDLQLDTGAERPMPVSTALWRNLGGFPASEPYRSIGVEPMLGRVFDLAAAGPEDAATVPPGGVATWVLRITALRRRR